MDETSVLSKIGTDAYTLESTYFYVIPDKYPVSPGHSLIISKAHRAHYFDLTRDEKLGLIELIDEVKHQLDAAFNPDGYNIGMNYGEAAGQTVFHFIAMLLLGTKVTWMTQEVALDIVYPARGTINGVQPTTWENCLGYVKKSTKTVTTGLNSTGQYVNMAIDPQTMGNFSLGKFGLQPSLGDRLTLRYQVQEKNGQKRLRVQTAPITT